MTDPPAPPATPPPFLPRPQTESVGERGKNVRDTAATRGSRTGNGGRSADVAVLGAGPAGLMAALRLARAGRSVIVLERADHVGGMAGSFEVAGVRVDYGSHRLHPVVAPRLEAELRTLLGDDLQARTRRGRIALDGRWLGFPLRLGDMARHAPKPFLARVALETATAPLRRPRHATAADVISARLGPTVANRFYTPYLTKLWGTSPHELSVELADRRVSARSGIDVVKRALRARNTEGRTFYYPRRGFGQISEVLADAAVEAGADLRLGAEVAGLTLSEVGESAAGSTVALADGTSVDAGCVLSSVPVPLLARLAEAPADVLEAASRLRHRAMVLAYLVLDTDRLSAFDAHYFPGLETPVSRLSEPKNFRDAPSVPGRGGDPDGVTVVCAELACWEGDETWTATPDELAERVRSTLAPLGFELPAVLGAEVRRIPKCYPVYAGAYAAALEVLERWAGRHPRLLTFGRQGLFAPDNTHHALHMGWEAADSLRADLTVDTDRWAVARAGFRTHVVED